MASIEERLEKLEYYQSLLMEMVDYDKKPFYALVIKANLTKAEVEEIFRLCELLSKKYKKQKAEGLVVFTPLLTEFAGMLTPKLDVEQTIEMMIKQNMFIPLMNQLKEISLAFK